MKVLSRIWKYEANIEVQPESAYRRYVMLSELLIHK